MRPTFVAANVGKTAHAAKAPGKLPPGSLRFSQRTAGSELAPFGRSDMRNRKSPIVMTSAAAILGAIEAEGWLPNVGCV